MTEYLKISEEHDHMMTVEFLTFCGVDWSTDGTTWHRMLTTVPPGTILIDHDAPAGRRRNYRATVNGQPVVEYLHEDAARAWAWTMGEIFGATDD